MKQSIVLTVILLLIAPLVHGQAPDKARDLTKTRQTERERAAAMIPIVAPAKVYQQFFMAMKEGRYQHAANAMALDCLQQIKRDVVNALKKSSLDERAAFIKAGGFKSAPDIQLSAPSRVFVAWMRSGWRVQGTLEKYRQREIESVKEKIIDNTCELTVEYKPAGKEKIALALDEREWRLKLDIYVE